MSDESDAFASADEGEMLNPKNPQIPPSNQNLSPVTTIFELSSKSTSKSESIVKEPESSSTVKCNSSTKKKKKIKKSKKFNDIKSKNVSMKSDQLKSGTVDAKVEQVVDEANNNKDVVNNLATERKVTQKLLIDKNLNASSDVKLTSEELSKSEHQLFVSESHSSTAKDAYVMPEISISLNEPQKLCDVDVRLSVSGIVSNHSIEKSNFSSFNNSDIITSEGTDSENDVSKIRSSVSKSISSSRFTGSNSFENENFPHHSKENLNVKEIEPISSFSITDQKLSESIPELKFISSTASHIVRGLGDGFNTLAGVFQDVVNFNVNIDTEDSKEGKKSNIDAWNEEWSEEWGDNDGWDVDSTDIIKTTDSKILDTESGSGDENSELSTKFHQPIHSDHSNQSENTQDENSIYSGLQKTLNVRSWDWNGVSSFAQQLTSSIQNTSLDIVQGGVDVLELIGRKTMSVLAENDPGYEYTKRFLRPPHFHNQPTLSKILREAHELHSNQISSDQCDVTKQKRGNFTHQLELNRALIHLEALELVSEQAQIQLNIRLESITSLSSDNNLKQLTTPNKGLLDQIWNNLQIDNDDEDDNDYDDDSRDNGDNENTIENDKLCKHLKAIQTSLSLKNKYLWSKFIRILQKLNCFYSYEQLVKTLIDLWNTTQFIQQNLPVEEVFFQSLSYLSQFTSAYLEYLHKFSECLLVRNQESNADYVEVSKLLSEFFQFSLKLQLAFCSEYMKIMKNLSSSSLTASNTSHSQAIPTSQSVGDLLVECGNAESYLKNASNLLVPIIQLTCVNSMVS